MTLLLELGNSSNWVLNDFKSFSDPPLPNYTPATQFDKHILAILVNSSDALETWHFGGWVSQKIYLGIGQNRMGESISNYKLWLRRSQLLIFPKLTTNYTLEIRFPSWFANADCTIWEYWEPEADTISNQIFDVNNSVIRVENKINLLL